MKRGSCKNMATITISDRKSGKTVKVFKNARYFTAGKKVIIYGVGNNKDKKLAEYDDQKYTWTSEA